MVEQIEHPTRWRWTDTADPYRTVEEIVEPEIGSMPSGGTCAAYFPAYGSWFRAANVAYLSPIDGSVGWYELELECTPAYTNGDPDTEAWGPVEEHGFECMGLPEDHTHDHEAVKWMDSINSALNVQFLLEEFE
jgi:hypothetical protein